VIHEDHVRSLMKNGIEIGRWFLVDLMISQMDHAGIVVGQGVEVLHGRRVHHAREQDIRIGRLRSWGGAASLSGRSPGIVANIIVLMELDTGIIFMGAMGAVNVQISH